MKQLFLIPKTATAIAIAAALVMSVTVPGDASRISSLRIEQHTGSSSYVIAKSGELELQDFMMEDPPRLVLDFVGAEHELDKNKFEGDGKFVKSVRTSQFTTDPEHITRIVFDLQENVAYELSNAADAVTIRFFSKKTPTENKESPRTMGASVSPMNSGDPSVPDLKPRPLQDGVKDEPTPSGEVKQQTSAKSTDQPATQAKNTKQPTSEAKSFDAWLSQPAQSSSDGAKTDSSPKKASQSFGDSQQSQAKQESKPTSVSWATSSKTQNSMPANTMNPPKQTLPSYTSNAGLARNKNMTIDVQNAHVRTVLRSMSEFSGTNIISGPEVDGKVTAHLKNVPWRQALDIILKSHGYGWREEYGVIRVSTLDKLTKEELELQAAERQKDDLLPLTTEIMSVSFANAEEIKKALKEMLTQRGSIEVEKGNNALVVTDIEKNVRKIEVMVTELDRKTKQVEIVAKMVDVDFEASREIGIRWDALNLAVSDVGAVGDAVVDAQGSDPIGTLRVGTVQSWGQLQAILDALEKEQKANIISNPRIVTADNREANILVGKEIPLIVSDEAGNPITELTKVGIILRVTPHVNSDNTVTLDLHPEVSELSAQATVQGGVIISLSEADTRVVVGHGETAVIGGLINEVESTLERGVPGLMKLPFIGNLFKLKNKTRKKRELIIFVTPKIVDQMVSNQ
ncbi:MAG: type IV pilus secretin PilQ [Candidatus Krumholzibacteria bacterium]|nr:type IV pilus secretin PilQ [Candidatus Krumholzibacteria bacterium]